MLETAVRDGTKKRLHPCALYAPRMFGRVNGERNVEKYLHIYIDYHNTLSKAAPMHMLVVCNALTMFNWCKDAGRLRIKHEEVPEHPLGQAHM